MNKRFHIGWVFLVLGIGLALSIILLYKTITWTKNQVVKNGDILDFGGLFWGFNVDNI